MATAAGHEHAKIARRAQMLVLHSPPGAGKPPCSRKLPEADPMVDLSISVTMRKHRPGEIAGEHYHFVDDAGFDRMVREVDLLEWAQVFGNRYGTPRAAVDAALARGRDVL